MVPARLTQAAAILLCAAAGAAQERPLLTLDEAVALALRQNRPVQSALLDVAKYDDRLAQNRTKSLPNFKFDLQAGVLLQHLDFIFDRGSLGALPGLGPIPAQNTTITTPIRLTALLYAQIAQPLSQQYKIRLGDRQLRLGKQIAQEQVRAKRQTLAQNVKQVYYAILQSQSAAADIAEQIKVYRELERTTTQYFQQQTALKSDLLEVKTRLAQSEYDLQVQQDNAATQKEQLNALLARDLRTAFELLPIPEELPPDLDLAAVQSRALAARPEVLQAKLLLQQAEVAHKLSKAENIPDISATLSDVSPLNYGRLIPSNIPTAGIALSWEPFDWGRRKREASEKQRSVEQARLGVQETGSQVLSDVNGKYRQLTQSRQALKVVGLAREAARENLRITMRRYEQQAALLQDVLQAQARVAGANDRHSQALLGFWNARAELERAMGEE